ncbi:hypothetical protein [Mycobacterium shimoidei]|uniref:hypothetical protein n=1 Tax=Mycobacterium shimoidei TaxID=29313 RepID=UPI0012F4B1D5|nr:hypothetical protein [Mycobacterium shimoidei]MCV7258823.1 hypothetical protein [Mycobacterium shimoidei]
MTLSVLLTPRWTRRSLEKIVARVDLQKSDVAPLACGFACSFPAHDPGEEDRSA